MKTILLVTDNRYWRDAIGSQKRIAALCRHLEQRYRLHVLFLGKLNAEDARLLAAKPFEYPLYSEPGVLSDPAGTVNPAVPSLPVRATVKQIAIELRRRFTPSTGVAHGPRRFLFQIHEPKLDDYRRPAWADRFRKACSRVRPAVVVVEYVRLAWLLDACKDALGQDCRTIVDTHDVQHLRQAMFHAEGRAHDIDITPGEEAAALARADAVIAIQSEDARALGDLLPGKPILLAPHPQALAPQEEPTGIGLHIGFFGSAMAPNVDAARHLLQKLWPRLRAQCANLELHFFGAVCDALQATGAAEGVVLHGFVDDLAGAYAGLHLVLNPVTYGGGLKIKSVEALGHAKPLVTTAVGAQGLEVGAGRAFILSRDDDDFVASVVRLLRDASARRRLAEAAREFASQRFSPAHAFDELDRFIEPSCVG